MRTSRLIVHSLRTVRRFKLRSAFMMLGTVVGTAALVLVLCAGGAAERKVLATVSQLFGASSLVVMAGGTGLMTGPRPDAARLTLDDVEAIVEELPQIEAWDPQQAMPGASVRHDGATATVRVLGASERFERVWSRGVSRGETFDAADVSSSARVALVGETVVAELFAGAEPLDAEIQVGSVPFRVIGVLERFGTDIHGLDRDDEIVVPLSTMQRRLLNVDTIATAKLLVADPSLVADTAEEVKRILRDRHGLGEGQNDDFGIISATAVQKMVAKTQRVLGLYLPLVAGVALLTGAVVAASLMLAAVQQRVGEIGLRRAVGARAEDVGLQFLVETAVTALGGGILGVVVGVVGSRIAAERMHLGEVFSWWAIVLALAVATATGLLAGVLPARRAARLAPADALR